jgi:L-cystine uptake protein TcyP (sodium:dicarboxylate symporter family)
MAFFTFDNLWTLLALIAFGLAITVLLLLKSRLKLNFSWRVLIALAAGILFGVIEQLIFGPGSKTEAGRLIKLWLNILGSGFVNALQFVVVPLVLVSIIKSIAQFGDAVTGAKTAGRVIAFLLVTTALSTIITIITTRIYNLSADQLINTVPTHRDPIDIPTTILKMVPINLFQALSSNSILPIVFISAIVGFANLAIKKKNATLSAHFESALEVGRVFIMEIVHMVIDFTPYGVLAIVTNRAAEGTAESIKQLGLIIAAAFTAMIIIFALHMLIVLILRVNPVRYIKKAAPPLIFAFSSRSSSASLPMTIRSLRILGVPESSANLAATLGTCIGQNACSGMQPVLVAILVAQTQGMAVWTFQFMFQLLVFVVIASIGTAGVGGGATNVSIIVLGMIGLPLDLVGILVSVDFIIDMGRTAVNVSDSIVAGLFVSRWEKSLDEDKLMEDIEPTEGEEGTNEMKSDGGGRCLVSGGPTYTAVGNSS